MVFNALIIAVLLSVGLVSCSGAQDGSFKLPTEFLGLWAGTPDFNIMGPLSSYLFSISLSPEGDYLFENNLIFGQEKMGYQRFYVEGSGSTLGTLWYCGSLKNFSDSPAEQTGGARLNAFKPVVLPSSSDLNVTFCLDSTNKQVMGPADMNPFMKGCITCDCANWTIAYDPARDVLVSQMSMSGSDGHTHSKHMWAELKKIGPPPVVEAGYMPGHGSNFSCEFSEGGRDSTAVDRSWLAKTSHGFSVSDKTATGDTSSAVKATSSSGGCPFAKLFVKSPARPRENVKAARTIAGTNASFEHCYTLNDRSGFNLAWTLDLDAQTLLCSVSAPVLVSADGADNRNTTWVAIGFRPMSRSHEDRLIVEGSGHHMNFGMEGADIVAGSVSGGVRAMYAALYTGPPTPDASLKTSDTSVEVVDSASGPRVVVKFTRPLVGGYLNANFGNDGSILSGFADILWAVGLDSSASDVGCNYHDNNRGMRVVDWANPEIAMVEAWMC